MIHWIDGQSHVVIFPRTDRGRRIAAACFETALEHQHAIAELAQKELWGSAHALVRSGLEAFVRGAWFWRCASAKELQSFEANDDVDKKKFGVLVEEVERAFGTAKVLTRIKALHWKALCSFAHTGLSQVSRRYTAGELRPNYPPVDSGC